MRSVRGAVSTRSRAVRARFASLTSVGRHSSSSTAPVSMIRVNPRRVIRWPVTKLGANMPGECHWLTFNARHNAANQPARVAQLDDGNDRAILVQDDEGSAQVVRLGHRGTPSLDAATKLPILAARPIASFGSGRERVRFCP